MIPAFETSRLAVTEAANDTAHFDIPHLLNRIVEVLTSTVVENLPPYFQNINSAADAQIWFDRMVAESRLFVVMSRDSDSIVGFLFAHTVEDQQAHIGYLLVEEQWGKGLASELLKGFVEFAIKQRAWTKLIAGVDKQNSASINLLVKSGFVRQSSTDRQVIFFEYPIEGTP